MRMCPAHKTLSPLLELPNRTKRRICFLSEITPDRSCYSKWIPTTILRQIAYQFIKSIDIALFAARGRDCDLFLIFEHKAHYSLPLYFVLVLTGKPTFFIVHDHQQCWRRSIFHKAGFGTLRFLVACGNFFPIHLELGDTMLSKGQRFSSSHPICIPHPHPHASVSMPEQPEKWQAQKFRVGVIGMLRPDKPTRRLVEALLKIQAESCVDFDVIIGTPFWQKEAWIDDLDIEIVDTSTSDAYQKALRSLHIIVLDFRIEDFYFRPSGVVLDAGMNGCFVLCPDYPVLKAQVSNPVKVGAVFGSYDDLPQLIPSSIARLRKSSPDFEQWRKARSTEVILDLLHGPIKAIAN